MPDSKLRPKNKYAAMWTPQIAIHQFIFEYQLY